jgi:hypothetical protein
MPFAPRAAALVVAVGALPIVLAMTPGGRPGHAAEVPAITRVVAAGQPAPGGGSFEHFGVESLPIVAPVNARGQVAFYASVLRGRVGEGLYLASGSRIVRVAADGDAAPGGGTLSGFSRHPVPALNDAGAVVFVAAVSGGRTVEGIFVAAGGRVRPVAVAGSAAPGIASGTLAAVDAPALNNRGDVAFLATVRRGRDSIEAVCLASARGLAKVVAQGDAAPAGGTFAGFGPPALDAGARVVYAAVVDGPAVPGGIFATEAGQTRMVLGAGDDTPVGGIFAKFSERVAVNDRGAVAFTAVLNGAAAREGVFLVDRAGVRKIAAAGEAAPGGGVFAHFGAWPALAADGTVAFTASVDGARSDVAIFVATAAGIARLVSQGDALPGGGTLLSFGLHPVVSMAPTGAVTFTTVPTATGQGSEALFSVSPSAR